MNLQRNQTKTIWFTGLPCSGKTTLARLLLQELQFRDFPAIILDGDEIRKGINKDLGYSEEDRLENIRRVSEISLLFLENGMYTVNSFLTPSEKIREIVRSVIPKERLIEIYLNTPLQICEQRDTKGMYKKARKGIIKDFTGVSADFEAPKNPDLTILTGELTIQESMQIMLEFLGLQ